MHSSKSVTPGEDAIEYGLNMGLFLNQLYVNLETGLK